MFTFRIVAGPVRSRRAGMRTTTRSSEHEVS
ncbi:hypothetical protein Ae168Ps1_6229c [Pseudonocardia sp. Ae168_Ps1]|nr:hypothetical protein Ae168Ps1_6229c [Pseudonocardia sp. Ae168_Ps1]